jgi:type IV pilus assembly protein PilW
MSYSYRSGAEIGELETKLFYLKSGSNTRPALFEASLVVTNGETIVISEQETLPNVDNFQIIYGEDTNNDQNIDFYRNADNVSNWNAVISVKIALLLSSEGSNISIDKNSFTYNESTYNYIKDTTPSNNADNRLRRSVTAVGTFRNNTL